MCNAHNHPLDCNCGWGGEGHKGRRAGGHKVENQWPDRIPPYSPSLLSFTVPNARCPVCKEPVFYYWNENGSSVFFDQLGHPWPKHPCTDRTSKPIPIVSLENIKKIDRPYHKKSIPVFVRLIKSQRRFLYQLICTNLISERDVNLYVVSKSKPDICVEILAEYFSDDNNPILKYLSPYGNVSTTKVFPNQFSASEYISSNPSKYHVELGDRAIAARKEEKRQEKILRKRRKRKGH